MAGSKWNEEYLYVKINLYIAKRMYNIMKRKKLLNKAFVDKQYELNGKQKVVYYTFEEVIFGAGKNGKHIQRIFEKNGTSRLSEQQVKMLTGKTGVSENYFKQNENKIIEISSNITMADWKRLFNSKYHNNYFGVPYSDEYKTMETKIGTQIENLIAAFESSITEVNRRNNNETYSMYYYYKNGEKCKTYEEKDEIHALMNDIKKIKYENWISCKDKWSEYIEILSGQAELLKAMNKVNQYKNL